MENFNFYINVDQCLNMSNFDMFFYRLQRNRQFHLSNVQFYDDEGEYSLKNALQNIRSFMDEHPYDVENFKIILGVRQIYYDHRVWKESALYKLLKIYYNLWDNKLFIQSKDTSRRNVSMIMLMEADISHQHTAIKEFSYSDDVLLLLKTLGLDELCKLVPENKMGTEQDMETWMFQQLEYLLGFHENNVELSSDADEESLDSSDAVFAKRESILRKAAGMLEQDPIAKRFFQQYLKNHVWEVIEEDLFDYEERLAYASPRKDFYDEFGIEEEEQVLVNDQKEHQQKASQRALWDFLVSSMVDFAQSLTGHYNVFQKELDRNSRASRQLALLSVVEYITADIQNNNYTGVLDKYENLDEENRRNWEQANNIVKLRQRYGFMLRSYKEELMDELQRLNTQIEAIESHTSLPEYDPPERIIGNSEEEESAYEGTIQDLLDDFKRKGQRGKRALELWKKTNSTVKNKIDCMENELEEYAKTLTEDYKRQLDQRRLKRKKAIDLCSQMVVEEQIRVIEKEKQAILKELNAPNMSMSIKFQDQLNALQSLEKTDKEVEHYLECQERIQVGSFLFLVGMVISTMFFHSFILQNLLMESGEMILNAIGFIGLVFLLLLFTWQAPIEYYYEKNRGSIERLQEELAVFLTGYEQKREQFERYINLINQLDAVNSYLELLERMKYAASLKSRKLLWHKVKICDHLDKLTYFDQMIDEVAYDSSYRKVRKSYALNENEDVIHNSLYWPQGETEV